MTDPKFKRGDKVYCDVEWKDGRITRGVSGTFDFYSGDKAYIKTVWGTVEVDPACIDLIGEN